MNRVYRYTVKGIGEFPLDMLRYDCAWPESQDDVGLIAASFRFGDEGYRESKKALKEKGVRLESNRAPTIARWESFVWTVCGVSVS